MYTVVGRLDHPAVCSRCGKPARHIVTSDKHINRFAVVCDDCLLPNTDRNISRLITACRRLVDQCYSKPSDLTPGAKQWNWSGIVSQEIDLLGLVSTVRDALVDV